LKSVLLLKSSVGLSIYFSSRSSYVQLIPLKVFLGSCV
jgi:hypothetical protein